MVSGKRAVGSLAALVLMWTASCGTLLGDHFDDYRRGPCVADEATCGGAGSGGGGSAGASGTPVAGGSGSGGAAGGGGASGTEGQILGGATGAVAGEAGSTHGESCPVPSGSRYCGVTLWPSGVIPYSYDASVPGPEARPGTMQSNIRVAMDAWQAAVGNDVIQFVQNAADPEHVVITNANACSSGVPGWDPALGVQMVSWSSDCSLSRELGHVIGLYDEQQRADRDRYVVVHATASVCNDPTEWKTCVPTEDDGNNLGAYDLSSAEQRSSTGSPPDLTQRDNGANITAATGAPSQRDAANVVELYSRAQGAWKRAVSMGIDLGATVPLSNELASGVSIATGSSPAVTRSSTSLEVFVWGNDDNVYRRVSSALGAPAWGGWENLGGSADSSPGAAALNGQSVVAVLRTGEVYLAEQSGGWLWSNVGKPSGVSIGSDPVLVASAVDQIDLLVRGSDDALWQRRRSAGIWSDWTSRGGALAGTPSAVLLSPGVVSVFSNTPSGDLVQANAVDDTWTSWFTPDNGACCLATGSGPAVVAPNATRLDVLIHGTDHRLWTKRWDLDTGWGPFQPLGGLLLSNPAAAALGTARIDAFFVGDNGGLWHRQHRNGRPNGDFDGDGLGDFSFFRPSTNTWHIAPRSGAPAYSFTFSGILQPGIPEDFDNDGRADPVVFGSGMWTIRRSTGDVDINALFGDDGDVRLNGDYDGDGLADYVVFRATDGRWHIQPSGGYGPAFEGRPAWSTIYGGNFDVMVPGDYDGDGKTDVALFRPREGIWFMIRSATLAGFMLQYGTPTDVPVPADYDGDGKTDIALFRPSEGRWYILSSVDGSETQVVLGTASDRLVPKDYDGDGKADPAVFTPSTGTWRIRRSTGGPDIVTTFGVSSDVVF